MPWGPWPGTAGGGGGGFPGFGGPPPQIASAGAGGGTGLASDSGHTHEANIVAYHPSAVAMQASGVVQQTFAAGVATPVATNIPATRVPFGAAAGTGILDSDQRFVFSVPTATTARAFVVNSGAPPTVANYGGTFTAVESTALGIQAGGLVSAMWSNTAPASFGPSILLKHGRGTPTAPVILSAGDTLGSLNFMGQIATAGAGGDFVSGVGISAFVQAAAVPGAGHLESVFHIFHRNTGAATGDSYLSQQAIGSAANTGIDSAIGVNNAGAAADTSGFAWFPSVAGAQTGVPASTIFLGNVAHRVDTTNQRWYGYIGGAWHFSTYMDYDPTATRIPFGGVTAHTLTDAATFTMAAGVLTIGSSSAAGERPAILLNQATAQALSKTGGTLTIGTTDANPLAFMVNHGQVAYFDNATGALTPNAAVTYDLGSAVKAWTTLYTTIAISPTALSLTGSTSLSLTSGTTSITSDSKTVTIFKTNGAEVFRLQDDSTRVRFAAPSWEATGSAVGTLTNLPDGTTSALPSDYLMVEFSDGTKRVIPAWFFSNA